MDGATGRSPLSRSVGRRALLFFVVGDILGAGIYALTGAVAAQVGGALWAPFLLAFVLAGLTATAYAELVGKYPQAAGAALYANKALGRPFVTFIVAFAVMMSGVTSAAAAARAFGGDYLAAFVSVPTVLAALAFLAVVSLVNFIGMLTVGQGQRRPHRHRGGRPPRDRRDRRMGAGPG